MCGIFGMIIADDNKSKAREIKRVSSRLFILSESRGKESSGAAVLTDETIRAIKKPVSAHELIRSCEYNNILRDKPRAIIGHARLVTNGSMELNYNNQPIIKNGIVAVHNGIIVNDYMLWQKYSDLRRKYEVDTEIILDLFRKYESSLLFFGAVREIYRQIYGVASIAMLFEDYSKLLLATNNGSLYVFNCKDRRILYFASEEMILKKAVNLNDGVANQIKPNRAVLVDLGDLEMLDVSLKDDNMPDNPINKKSGEKFKLLDLGMSGSRSQFSCQDKKAVNFEKYLPNTEKIKLLKRCSVCILPETMPFIKFDENGVCNYCRGYSKMKVADETALKSLAGPHARKNGRADCIVPLSGGRDSSFGLHYVKSVLGMNPVAFSYDWGMITDLGRRNQSRICAKLGVEHIIISADIRKKRNHIRKNVLAWLKKPNLGTIPLFMAGDKQYFYFLNKLKKQLNVDLILYPENPLEKTDFKTGFCGAPPDWQVNHLYNISWYKKIKLGLYYLRAYILNPAYVNSSLIDTLAAYMFSYFMPHDYLYIYKYVKWSEERINSTLISEYDWEFSPDTKTSWRIGDGTASFYNYIYYTLAGFTENDTFRSNQIREEMISRQEALAKANEENQPRWDSIKWYCDTINIDFEDTLKKIIKAGRKY